MRIGATPTHTFTLPEDVASVTDKVKVVYSQNYHVVLTKEVTELEGNNVVVQLTQEDTLKFHNRKPVDIQLRLLTNTGGAMTSDIITKTPYDCLDRTVFK